MRHLLCAAALAAALALPCARAAVVVDTNGFEGFAPGVVNGQNGWAAVNAFGQPSKDAVIATAPGGGKAICFDNTGGATDPHTESGVQITFPNLTGTERYVTTSFDLYREGNGLYNNMWWWPVGNNPWSGLQWDNAANPNPGAQILPWGFGSPGPNAPMPANQWVNLTLEFDLQNFTESVWVNGVLLAPDVPIPIGTTPGEFAGWFFDDTNTIDPARSPNAVGQRAYVDNLRIVTGRFAPIPEPATLSLIGIGILPLLRRRRAA